MTSDNDHNFYCIFRYLEDYERGFALGYELIVEQFDGDRHYFADTKTQSAHERATLFIERHGLTLLTIDEMDEARTTTME